jgi:receptor protein-tyrosine kinase/non-specific protein-tyrosine kinase
MSRIEEALENANRKRGVPEEPELQPSSDGSPRMPEDTSHEVLQPMSPYLVMMNGNSTAVTEEYKKLKSMVVKLTRKDQFKNTLMVTSAMRDEGKSITALNLAMTLAQEYDSTVLLVDADLRKPSLSRYLRISPSVGLSDCLLKGIDVGKALIRTGIGKLVVLPAGKTAANPVELLLSEKMKDLVKELKQRYGDRYVIFDTPPVLPFAEVHSLASLVDGVLFVIREGHAPLSSIKGALEMLKDTPVLGSVLNCASLNTANGYYYGYDQYYGNAGKSSR